MRIDMTSQWMPRGISKLSIGDAATLCVGPVDYPAVVRDKFSTIEGQLEIQFASTAEDDPFFIAVVPPGH